MKNGNRRMSKANASRTLLLLLAFLMSAAGVPQLETDTALAQSKALGPQPADDDDEAPARPWTGGEAAPPQDAPIDPDHVIREELPQTFIDKDDVHVERNALAPVGAADGAPLPASAWAGPPASDLEALITKIAVPLRSWSLARTYVRLLEADTTGTGTGDAALLMARASQLEAMGLLDQALKVLAPLGPEFPGAVAARARLEIGQGMTQQGCDRLATTKISTAGLDTSAQIEAALLAGHCAMLRKDVTQAGLAAGIARDLGTTKSAGPELLEAIAAGSAPTITKGKTLSPLDYRILELGMLEPKGAVEPALILEAATPALLVTLARSETASDELRLPAAERAARLGLVSTADLAAAYRLPHPGGTADTIERAALVKRIEAELTPLRKARLIRAFLDEAHRQDMHVAGYLLMMAPISTLSPSPELAWFAETAIEVSLLSARFDTAHRWADAFAASAPQRPGGSIALWRALIEIAEPKAPGSPRDVASLAGLAAPAVATPELMWRLSASLDALDIGVPTALWDARSSLAEPSAGHLPATGVLTKLKEASDKREVAHTFLLALDAVGPKGPEGAHVLALGDVVRALKRAGLDEEARLVVLEALIPLWPRLAVE